MRNLLKTRKRKALLTLATCTVAGLAGLVWAQWLVESDGQGRGKTSALAPLVVSPGTPPAGGTCFPSETCSLHFSVQNPNPDPVTITAARTLGTFQINTGSTACPGGNHFVPLTTPLTGLNIPVPPAGPTQIEVDGLVRLSASAPTDCQAITFTTGTNSVRLTATH